jgi:hypothetical protein
VTHRYRSACAVGWWGRYRAPSTAGGAQCSDQRRNRSLGHAAGVTRSFDPRQAHPPLWMPGAQYEVVIRSSELTKGRMAVADLTPVLDVRMADRILVLKGGELVEQGTHEALVTLGGLYSELFQPSGGIQVGKGANFS